MKRARQKNHQVVQKYVEGETMKRLTKKMTISPIDISNIMNLKSDFEKIGSVNIKTYNSKFSILFPDWGKIIESKSSEMNKTNHIEFFLNEKKVIQFFKSLFGFSGYFLDQNFPYDLNNKIEMILVKNGYYTNRTAWKYAPWLPLINITAIFIFSLLLGINIFIVSYLHDVSIYKLLLICISFLAIIIYIYNYKQLYYLKNKN